MYRTLQLASDMKAKSTSGSDASLPAWGAALIVFGGRSTMTCLIGISSDLTQDTNEKLSSIMLQSYAVIVFGTNACDRSFACMHVDCIMLRR